MIRCGTDIIEVERIKDGIENIGDKFLNRIYTETEIEYCNSKNVQKYQSFAGRFAAKEAIFKALTDVIENKYQIDISKFPFKKLYEFIKSFIPPPSLIYIVKSNKFVKTNHIIPKMI